MGIFLTEIFCVKNLEFLILEHFDTEKFARYDFDWEKTLTAPCYSNRYQVDFFKNCSHDLPTNFCDFSPNRVLKTCLPFLSSGVPQDQLVDHCRHPYVLPAERPHDDATDHFARAIKDIYSFHFIEVWYKKNKLSFNLYRRWRLLLVDDDAVFWRFCRTFCIFSDRPW